MWDETTFPFPNFNGATVEIWEWISNFISQFTGYVIIYPQLVCGVMCVYSFIEAYPHAINRKY